MELMQGWWGEEGPIMATRGKVQTYFDTTIDCRNSGELNINIFGCINNMVKR